MTNQNPFFQTEEAVEGRLYMAQITSLGESMGLTPAVQAIWEGLLWGSDEAKESIRSGETGTLDRGYRRYLEVTVGRLVPEEEAIRWVQNVVKSAVLDLGFKAFWWKPKGKYGAKVYRVEIYYP